jgi:hypothetical protein
VTRIEENAAKRHAVEAAGGAGERHYLIGALDPDPSHPDVLLHEDTHGSAGRMGSARERLEHLQRVQRDLQVEPCRQPQEAVQLGRTHGRIGEQKVVREVRHDLRLVQRRDREAAGTRVQLHARDRPRLVGLDVRPPAEPVRVGVGDHARRVFAGTG